MGKTKWLLPILVVAFAASLLLVGSAGAAATGTYAPGTSAVADLSGQSVLGSTTTYNVDGSSVTSSVALDTTASTAMVTSSGYLCGNVQYRATQKWYDFWGIVLWTYRSTFGVHVCNNKVTGKTALYDEAMDSTLGWGWCGNIVKTWGMNPNNASAHSYTKGCFNVLDKILVVEYPWAKMTIGGNGNLWARDTGVS